MPPRPRIARFWRDFEIGESVVLPARIYFRDIETIDYLKILLEM